MHIITIPISSAVLEALTSLLFEFFLLCFLSVLAQAICAHINVRRLYDFNLPVKINSLVLPLRVHAPVGHLPVAITLALLLLISSLMNNVLSFAINGRSEPIFVQTRHNALVSFSQEVRPIPLNFGEEFREREDDEYAPPLISERLRAIRMADQCMQCNYTHCTIYAYTIDSAAVNTTLVHPDKDFESTCVTPEIFRHGIVWEEFPRFPNSLSPTVERQLHLDPVTRTGDSCEIMQVETSFSDGALLSNATLRTGVCNLALRDAVCFKRPRRAARCAAVAMVPSGGLKVLLFGIPGNKTDSAKIAWVTRGDRMRAEDFRDYSGTVAYMDSLRLAGDITLLQRMATASIESKVIVEQRAEGQMELVSDVDLRIALPGVVFNFVLLLVLIAVDIWLWYVGVYSKGRQGINAMSSVQEMLAALSDEKKTMGMEQERFGVAIAQDRATLSVQRCRGNTEDSKMKCAVWDAANDWNESEIL